MNIRSLPSYFALLPVLAALFTTACTAPRAIVATGKVTPKGEFRVAYNEGFNIATEPLSKAGSAVKEAASQLASQQADKGQVDYSASVDKLQAAALAYVLDPVQATADLGIRYGIAPRLDAGYKYAFGSHVFDAQYQLIGSTGTPQDFAAGIGRSSGNSAAPSKTYVSVGLQFATQRAKLPSLAFLSDINDVLNFRATRNDLLVPLIVSHSFGPEETIGAFSYGVVYAHSWVTYSFAPSNLYTGSVKVPDLPTQSRNFSSFGAFINLKIGYKYTYLVPALSVFYQNYGDYTLLNGSTTSLSGITFVPSIGLQVRIPNLRNFK